MTEIPQQLPIEEQVKQDSRFSFISKNESYLVMLVQLRSAQENNPENLHSEFWLEYMRCINVYFQDMSDVLVDDVDFREYETRQRNAMDGMDPHIKEGIETTEGSDVFEDIGVKGMYKGMTYLKQGNVLADLPFLFSVIDRVGEMA